MEGESWVFSRQNRYPLLLKNTFKFTEIKVKQQVMQQLKDLED